MPAFWDASALVPLCLPGAASTPTRQLLREYKPVVWWGSPVEVARALARLRREGRLSAEQVHIAARRLEMLQNAWREVEPVEEVREAAERCVSVYELRAAEALQLGAALVWCRQRPARRIFLCNDHRLGEAARQAGFTVSGC